MTTGNMYKLAEIYMPLTLQKIFILF